MSQSDVHLLAAHPNQLGDLLTQLMDRFLQGHGYRIRAVNVHKTGREIDIVAEHRLEPRECRVECKSGARRATGGDVNKFAGIVDLERRRDGPLVSAYFISLAGFTAEAMEQEREVSPPRLALLDAAGLRRDLIEAEVIVDPRQAVLQVGRLAHSVGHVVGEPDLIGHARGWLWAVYLDTGTGQAVCLVDAHGRALPAAVAREVMAAAAAMRHPLARCALVPTDDDDLDSVRRRYLRYLEREVGVITMRGLPADYEPWRRFTLESLYEPTSLIDLAQERFATRGGPCDETPVSSTSGQQGGLGLGEAVAEHAHLAIVGLPGSGKTTIIRRLALAYADDERRRMVDDRLPDMRVLPLLIQCRQFKSLRSAPMRKIIGEIAALAGMPEARDDLLALVGNELAHGQLLVLVDGLDEITDVGKRVAFARALALFVRKNPRCRLVLTSREVGYRPVAHLFTPICRTLRVDDLSDTAITSMVHNWHTEVMGNSPEVVDRAKRLAQSILEMKPVRELASTPLLLTILLLVQHGMSRLPRQRTMLYERAIEVLASSWNSEAHEPLDHTELVTQLGYVAYEMMRTGRSSVTKDELADMIKLSREAVPGVLGLVTTSPYTFVDQVEERTSLLVRNGQRRIHSVVVDTYEFKHLIFQAYLAAVAITQEWVSTPSDETGVNALLADRLTHEGWQEVVSLATVLSGTRGASAIMSRLISTLGERHTTAADIAYANLVSCLRDDVRIDPRLAHDCLTAVLAYSATAATAAATAATSQLPVARAVHGGRFTAFARDLLLDTFTTTHDQAIHVAGYLAEFAALDCMTDCPQPNQYGAWITSRLEHGDERERLLGAGAAMHLAFLGTRGAFEEPPDLTAPADQLLHMIDTSTVNEDRVWLMRLWAAVWLLQYTTNISLDDLNKVQVGLARLAMTLGNPEHARLAAWALTCTEPTGTWHVTEHERQQLLAFAHQHSHGKSSPGQSDLDRVRTYAGFMIRHFLADRTHVESLRDDIQAYCASGAPVRRCVVSILSAPS